MRMSDEVLKLARIIGKGWAGVVSSLQVNDMVVLGTKRGGSFVER